MAELPKPLTVDGVVLDATKLFAESHACCGVEWHPARRLITATIADVRKKSRFGNRPQLGKPPHTEFVDILKLNGIGSEARSATGIQDRTS